jgi:hypothetical protein
MLSTFQVHHLGVTPWPYPVKCMSFQATDIQACVSRVPVTKEYSFIKLTPGANVMKLFFFVTDDEA